jgi:large subunit ribosomal protein L24
MASKIKKGDSVIILCGKDKGKTGEVLKSMPTKSKVLVAGINMAKKHTKPSAMSEGGIVAKEMPIHVSNVSMIDPKTKKATRVGFKQLKDGKKVRFAKKSGEIID